MAMANNPATKGVGYVETPTPKKCGTCIFLVKGNLCNNREARQDKQMRTDPKTLFKIVDAETGCCNEWQEPKKVQAKEDVQAQAGKMPEAREGKVQDGKNGLKYRVDVVHVPSNAGKFGKPQKEGVSP